MGVRRSAVGGDPHEDAPDLRIPVGANALVHELAGTDETVLFAKDRGDLLLLNDLGAGVYYLIDGRRTVAEITKLLQDEFPEAESVRDDVVGFLTTLEAAGVLRFV